MTELPLCFVIMPFDAEFKGIFNTIIKDTAQELGFTCQTAEEATTGHITKTIFESIYFAKVIIADLTNSNANVFYELGVAHSIGRKTILISQDKTIPFDISHDLVIFYDNSIQGGEKLRNDLDKSLRKILNGGTIDNPTQMFLPKSLQEEKIDELQNKSEKLLHTFAKSRLIEMKFVAETMGFFKTEAKEEIEKDVDRWQKLIDESFDSQS